MRKGLIYLSTALTAFAMAVLGGVVRAYNSGRSSVPSTRQISSSVPRQFTAPSVVLPTTPVQASPISPQDAAAVAAKYLNRTDLYSVELADFNGAQVYKVTFSSSDVVYVSLAGQVLAAVPPQPVVVASSPPGRGHAGGESESRGGGGENEGGDD